MNDVLQVIGNLSGSIGDLISSIDQETARDIIIPSTVGAITGILAKSKDLRKVLGDNSALVHGVMVPICLASSFLLTQPIYALAGLVTYTIAYGLSNPNNPTGGDYDNGEDEIKRVKDIGKGKY